jgi:hypothetical protein
MGLHGCSKPRGHQVVLELRGCWVVLELKGHLHMVFGRKKTLPFSYNRMKIFFHEKRKKRMKIVYKNHLIFFPSTTKINK